MTRVTSRDEPNPEPMRESSGQTALRPTMYVRPFSQTEDWEPETPMSESRPMPFSNPRDWDRFALNPTINGQQMRTLIDPVEHIQRATHSVDVEGMGGSMSEMWSRKRREAREEAGYGHGSGVYDWMEAGEKQRDPITVMVDPGEEGYGQEEGHHRAAAAADISEEKGTPHLVKMQAWHHGLPSYYEGGTARENRGLDRYDDYDDYDDYYEPTPTRTTQRATERINTPRNQPQLPARTSRREAFSWNNPWERMRATERKKKMGW